MRRSPAILTAAAATLILVACTSDDADANPARAGMEADGEASGDADSALAAMFSCGTAPGEAADADCPTDDPNPYTMPIEALTATIADLHPAYYYALASRLFEAGDKDEAVFWLYAGQLRYRIRLGCHPEFEPSGEPALFGSLQMVIGTMVNQYAGADTGQWAAAMQRALDWDAATDNGFEPKSACGPAIEEARAGLTGLREQVLATADEIRATREANGLPNSGE